MSPPAVPAGTPTRAPPPAPPQPHLARAHATVRLPRAPVEPLPACRERGLREQEAEEGRSPRRIAPSRASRAAVTCFATLLQQTRAGALSTLRTWTRRRARSRGRAGGMRRAGRRLEWARDRPPAACVRATPDPAVAWVPHRARRRWVPGLPRGDRPGRRRRGLLHLRPRQEHGRDDGRRGQGSAPRVLRAGARERPGRVPQGATARGRAEAPCAGSGRRGSRRGKSSSASRPSTRSRASRAGPSAAPACCGPSSSRRPAGRIRSCPRSRACRHS